MRWISNLWLRQKSLKIHWDKTKGRNKITRNLLAYLMINLNFECLEWTVLLPFRPMYSSCFQALFNVASSATRSSSSSSSFSNSLFDHLDLTMLVLYCLLVYLRLTIWTWPRLYFLLVCLQLTIWPWPQPHCSL